MGGRLCRLGDDNDNHSHNNALVPNVVTVPEGGVLRVLVIEDDQSVRYWIGAKLRGAGHDCRFAGDGEEALSRLRDEAFDVAVLDRMLPGADGLEVLRRLRGTPHPPILILSALGESGDRVAGLRAGAEDYLAKPFDFAELLIRLERLAQRGAEARKDGAVLRFADLTLDLSSRRVARGGIPIDLTDKEFRLLHILMSNPGRTVSRTMLLEGVWGDGFSPPTNLIEVHVSKLRAKIDRDFTPALIKTVRAIGYVLG